MCCRIGRLLIAVALLSAWLMGCRPAAQAPVTLTIIMEQVPDTDVVRKLLPDFEKENPGIKVVIDAMPYDAMRDKILASFMAPKATYDVIIVDNPWMDEFVAGNFLEPLDDRIRGIPDYDFEDFVGPVREIGVVGGKVYGIPFYIGVTQLTANTFLQYNV